MCVLAVYTALTTLLTSPRASNTEDCNPTANLKEVVGAGDHVEAVTHRDVALLGACWSEIAKFDVGDEVRHLAELECVVRRVNVLANTTLTTHTANQKAR